MELESGADNGGYSEVASVVLDNLDALEFVKAIEQAVRGDDDGVSS